MALALAFLVGVLVRGWPSSEAPAAEPVPSPPPLAAAPAFKPAPPRQVLAAPVDRSLLLRAIQARAGELAACGPSPARLATRVRVAPDGAVRAVSFSAADRAPPEVSRCVRERVLAWKFPGLELRRETDLLVNFSLSPG